MAFFQLGALAGLRGALAAGFAADVQRVDLGDLDLEQFLHGLADLRLVARRSATTVYWLYFSPWRVPFSVRRTVLMISKEFMLFLGQTGLDFFKRALGEQQLVRAQHVVGVQRIARGQRHVRRCCATPA